MSNFIFQCPGDMTAIKIEYLKRKDMMAAKMMTAPLSYLNALEIYLDESEEYDDAMELEILTKLQKEMMQSKTFSKNTLKEKN